LRRIGLTNGLTSEQTLRLSDLVGRFYVEGSDVRWLEFQRPELRKLARNGKTRLRLLRTKLKDAQSSIQALLKYLDQIGVEVTLKSEDVLKRGLLVLDPSKLAGADELVSSLPTKGSRGTALLALFDFFSRDCRLERSDAEIRTAAIGNYLWDWKFAVVTTRPKKSDARLGCEAIRKAVARRRSDRDTSPRIR
jgi:hypothetical protein